MADRVAGADMLLAGPLLVLWVLCFFATVASVVSENVTTNVFSATDAPSESPSLNQGNETLQNIILNRKNPFDKRVVGGVQATKGRYPYMVSILTEGASESMPPVCGGSLIAPDIVLTAAHCIEARLGSVHVGRFDRTDPTEPFDALVIEQQIIHPFYREEILDFDIMLLKLSGESNNLLLSLNRNPKVPAAGDQMAVMGFGVTQLRDIYSSQTLQEGNVKYIPNDVCELASSPDTDETYLGKITNDMLCAEAEDGENIVDACQGDSGSPLIVRGTSLGEDVQVGIVSWGYRCAHPDFYGVYSRLSFHMEWIASQVCQLSQNPPSAFKCASTTVSAPSTAAQAEEQPVSSDQAAFATVTLRITFDSYASEISWNLKDSSGYALASVPFNTYEDGRDRAQRTFYLLEGKTYSFSIEDSYRDGLCCTSPGNYMIVLWGSQDDRILVFGEGNFGASASHDFVVPVASDSSEGANGFLSNSQTQSGTVPLWIVLQLDDRPSETGWVLERLGFSTEIVAQAPAGFYGNPREQSILSIELEHGELYRFTVLDTRGDGIDQGRVQLFLGERDQGADHAIYDHDGSFLASLDFAFLASPDGSPVGESTGEQQVLTLELRMDLYAEEIGVILRVDTLVGAVAVEKRSSSVIFFRPPGFYDSSYANQVVRETIPLPPTKQGSVEHYSLIVIDSFGDGLCCDWNGQSNNPGYTLYKGSHQTGKVLVSSSFSDSSREVFSFSITTYPEDQPNASPSADAILPSFEASSEKNTIRVVLNLDARPEETGYAIKDYYGKMVADVPPGSYHDPNVEVEVEHSVPPGVYFFTVLDSYGDGIVADTTLAPTYAVFLDEQEDRPPLLSGSRSFTTEERHAVVVEGSHAAIPVLIKVTGNSSNMVGFKLERLDLSEADAVVATVDPVQQSDGSSYTSSLLVQNGGLYRLAPFGLQSEQFIGSVRLAVGSHTNIMDVNINQQPKFLASAEEIVSASPPAVAKSDKFLSLAIPSHLGPSEIDWVLLSVTVEGAKSKRSVVSYGPGNNIMSYGLFNHTTVEKILLPPFGDKQTFMLILSHSGGNECCKDGTGTSGLIQLFQGTPEEGMVLVGTSFEGESRLVEIFHLDSPVDQSSATSFQSRALTWHILFFGGLLLEFYYSLFLH